MFLLVRVNLKKLSERSLRSWIDGRICRFPRMIRRVQSDEYIEALVVCQICCLQYGTIYDIIITVYFTDVLVTLNLIEASSRPHESGLLHGWIGIYKD